MFKKFIARRPAPRKAPVAPLQEAPQVSQQTSAQKPAQPAAEAAPAENGQASAVAEASEKAADQKPRPKELGGPSGPEPTRYGDWERKGICVDF